jgi:hypothetical protein
MCGPAEASWNPTDSLRRILSIAWGVAVSDAGRVGVSDAGGVCRVLATGSGEVDSFLVLPTVALDAQSGQGPFRA